MNTWMDADIRNELRGCWGQLDAIDTATALRNSIRLFATLATRTAAAWNLPCFDHTSLDAEIEASKRSWPNAPHSRDATKRARRRYRNGTLSGAEV